MYCNVLSHDEKMFAHYLLVTGITNLRSAQNAIPKVHYLGDWATIFLCDCFYPFESYSKYDEKYQVTHSPNKLINI